MSITNPRTEALALACAGVILSAAVSCSTEDSVRARIGVAAVVDRERKRIVLPMDRYSVSYRERRVIELAADLLLRDCMRRNGFDYVVIDRTDEPRPPERRYGVWLADDAAKLGYALPRPPAPTRRVERANRLPLRREEQAAIDHCTGSPALRSIMLKEPLPGDLAAFRLYGRVLASDNAVAVLNEWRDCLRTAGIATTDDAGELFVPAAVRSPERRTPKNLAIAVHDARCKADVHLVERLAALEAQAQAHLIARHAAGLEAQRRNVVAVVRKARDVIAGLAPARSPLPI
jgi:hypothetical protein